MKDFKIFHEFHAFQKMEEASISSEAITHIFPTPPIPATATSLCNVHPNAVMTPMASYIDTLELQISSPGSEMH